MAEQELLLIEGMNKGIDGFFVRTNNILNKVKLQQIKWIHAEGNYCSIHTDEKRYIAKISLKKFQDLLPASTFIRVHKSYVISIDTIEKVDVHENLVLLKGAEIPIGRA